MASTARLAALFRDVDTMLGDFDRPDQRVQYLRRRIEKNEECKAYLQAYANGRYSHRPPPPYTAFDLSEIEEGLDVRLASARAEVEAAAVQIRKAA